MNGYVQETQGTWRTLPQEYQQQRIVLLGHMLRHQMEGPIHRKENTTRNDVDKPPCLRQGAVHLKRGILEMGGVVFLLCLPGRIFSIS